MAEKNLNETLNTLFELGYVDVAVPQFIKDNLQHETRPYQEEAFRRFIYYLTDFKHRNEHAHLLFQMETGFLQSIEKEAELVWNFQNPTYKIIGLPFYNEEIQKSLFGHKLKEALNY